MNGDEMDTDEEPGGIQALGSDQILIILQFLPVPGIVAFGLTCHRFYDVVSSDRLWAEICRREWGDAVVDAWPTSRLRKRSWKQLYADMLACGAVAWHPLQQPESLPLARASHSMNNVAGKVFVFGGGCEGGRALGDTWIAPLPRDLHRGVHWHHPRIDNPTSRFGHSCVLVGGTTLVLFGGISDTGTRHLDTWINEVSATDEYPSSWRLLHVSQSPLARGAHACCYAGEKKVVVFGGIRNDGVRIQDTWLLDLSHEHPSWQEVVTEISPSARSGHTLSWIGGGRMILFGGRGAHFEVLNDVWLLSLEGKPPTWTELSPGEETPEAPSPRAGHSASLVFGNRILIFGGEDAKRSKKRDVWLLDPHAAASISISSSSSSSSRRHHQQHQGGPACSRPEKNHHGRTLWKKLRVRGQPPNRTSFHGACSLETGHGVLVFGGMVDDASSSGVVFNSDLFLLQLIP